jgi:hypothetical protein
MSQRPVKICLRLDNGDTIRGSVGDASAQLVRFAEAASQLSAEAQEKRLDDIAFIYQQLQEPSECITRPIVGTNVRLCAELGARCRLETLRFV